MVLMQLTAMSEKVKELTLDSLLLEIFTVPNASIGIVQWQPQSTLEFSEQFGFRPTATLHSQKALEFIKYARQTKNALVLTPEYSFPYETLTTVFNDRELWPTERKLWCIGMEGKNTDELRLFLEEKRENIHISNLNLCSDRLFANILVYLFVQDRNLYVIPQAKCQPASDKFNDAEKAYMSVGAEIIILTDDNKKRVFASLICADALMQNIEKINMQYASAELLLFIPQLNPSFLHQAFDYAFSRFLNINPNARIITANWAKDTSVINPKVSFRISHGFSSIMKNAGRKKSNDKLVRINHVNGLYFGSADYDEVWHISSNELVMTYFLRPFHHENVDASLQNSEEPTVSSTRCFNNTVLEEDTGFCNLDWQWLNNVFSLNTLAGIELCNLGQCDLGKCLYTKISIFIDTFLTKTILHDNKHGKEYMISPMFKIDSYTTSEPYTLRERITGMLNSFCNGELPPKFVHFRNNYLWNIGKKTKNIRVQNHVTDLLSEALIVFAEGEYAAKVFYDEIILNDSFGEDCAKRLLVYFLSAKGTGYEYYEPDENKEIVCGSPYSGTSILE